MEDNKVIFDIDSNFTKRVYQNGKCLGEVDTKTVHLLVEIFNECGINYEYTESK